MKTNPNKSLNENLTALGYTTIPAGDYRKSILKNGQIKFTGRAKDVWKWIRETQNEEHNR